MRYVSETIRREHSPAVRIGHDAVSAVKLSQEITAEIDAWAEAHQITRADAIRQLLVLALNAAPTHPSACQILRDRVAIEQIAIQQLDRLIDPELPTDERERRISRLIEGPSEFKHIRLDRQKQRCKILSCE